MKRTCKAFTGLVLALAFLLAGCQPTPDKDIVVNKGEGGLQSAIMATPAPIEGTYTAPEHYKDTFTKGNFIAEYDADVIVPPAEAYPVYRVKDAELTQAFGESLIAAVMGDNQIVNATRPKTKTELWEEMIEVLGLWNMYPEFQYENVKTEEELRKLFEDRIAAAPETSEDDMPVDRHDLPKLFDVKADTDGNGLYDSRLYVSEFSDERGFHIYYKALNEKTGNDLQQEGEGPTLPEEEARALAEEMVARMGFEDFALQYHKWDNGHHFVFSRLIGGTPCAFTAVTYNMGGYDDALHQDPMSLPWLLEMIYVVVNGAGIVRVEIHGLTEQVDLLNENVALLPFEEIMERAGEYLYFQHQAREWIELGGKTYGLSDVSTIKLRYVRIMEKDSRDQGFLLVPAWFFFLTENSCDMSEAGELEVYFSARYEDEETWPYLMINAIDGSNIGWYTGY